jgi:hypothetical protein
MITRVVRIIQKFRFFKRLIDKSLRDKRVRTWQQADKVKRYTLATYLSILICKGNTVERRMQIPFR